MDWSQGLYIGAMVAAFGFGSPHWLIVACMVFNLAATLVFSVDYISVGIADLISAALLLFAGRRGQIVALLFALMQPVYVLALLFKWQVHTTYAIVDLLAYAQLAVIGNLDVGIASARRWASDRRRNPDSCASKVGSHAENGVARILAKGRRE